MVKFEIDFTQLKKVIRNLPTKQRTRLLEELEKDTWQQRFRQLMNRIDSRRKNNPLSQEQINQIVKEAKSEYHAKSSR